MSATKKKAPAVVPLAVTARKVRRCAGKCGRHGWNVSGQEGAEVWRCADCHQPRSAASQAPHHAAVYELACQVEQYLWVENLGAARAALDGLKQGLRPAARLRKPKTFTEPGARAVYASTLEYLLEEARRAAGMLNKGSVNSLDVVACAEHVRNIASVLQGVLS